MREIRNGNKNAQKHDVYRWITFLIKVLKKADWFHEIIAFELSAVQKNEAESNAPSKS